MLLKKFEHKNICGESPLATFQTNIETKPRLDIKIVKTFTCCKDVVEKVSF